MLTVRERVDADRPAVEALLAAAADRSPEQRLPRRPGDGPALVAVDEQGAVRGHVRPVASELAPDDETRTYAADRAVSWADAAADGPDPLRALAAAVRATAPGAEADTVLWPAADPYWWAEAGLTVAGLYAVRPRAPLPGPLPPGYRTRAGTPADADAVVALHAEAVRFQAAASPYIRLLPSTAAGFRSRLESGKASSTLLVRDGRPVGVCEWWVEEGGLLPPGRWAYLNSVAVTAEERTGGLGRALVSAAISAADAAHAGKDAAGGGGLAGSCLWFSPPNPIASKVWPHLGWQPVWAVRERRAGIPVAPPT